MEKKNSGDWNSGDCNSGNRNSGDYNSGDCNSGDYNSGDCNSGYRNSGDYNSGNCNSGNYNSGYRNSGDYNSGDCNSGDYNSGDYNSGNCNNGDWNKTNCSSGCFNTVKQKIYFFNKISDWTYDDWLRSAACLLMSELPGPLEYICYSEMTEHEKSLHPESKETGGYLKKVDRAKAARAWWKSLDDNQRGIIMAIPNFDKSIFEEITGIDVEAPLCDPD